MKIMQHLSVIALLTLGANAYAYTPTAPTAIPSPTDGYMTIADNGTCPSDRTPIYPPGVNGGVAGACAYNVPADLNACPPGAFTMDGAGCDISPYPGDVVKLGFPGTDMSDPSKWEDLNTGAIATPSVVSAVNAILAASSGTSTGGTASGGTGTGTINIDFASILESVLGLQQGNTLGAISAAAGIVIGIALTDLGARKLKKLFGTGQGGKGGKGGNRTAKGGQSGNKGKKKVSAQPNARRVTIGKTSYTLYRGQSGRYTRGPALGGGRGRRRRR